MGELEQLLVAHIAANGPIGFDEYQAHVLYAPGLGFYQRGGGAGRRRDFLTSPEVGPLFGAVLARALDAWWADLGRPQRIHLVDAGAGPGGLTRSIIAAQPACGDALACTLVEAGEVQWATHPVGTTSRTDLPKPRELDGPVVVIANELLDNLPVSVVERTADGWEEVVVDVVDGRLAEGRRPLEPVQVGWCSARAPEAVVGARIPAQAEAAAWLREALELAAGGRVVVIDYARTSAEMAAVAPHEWLRTYTSHGTGGSPYDGPGRSDITSDVAIDQLALIEPPTSIRTQAEFLRAHGIDELVAEGRATWERLGLAGGLEAIAGRSRITEAEALLDPTGPGAFTVLEWTP
ncbi:MAG: SAM-dependent methyltransferase [Aquihabitans sp.]